MKRILAGVLAALFLFSCGGAEKPGYIQISAAEAKKRMEEDDGHIIVDVRTTEEYREGHIPEAVCIPLDEIGGQMPAELPDKNQTILIYCRSGNRSKQAAEKLAALGYTRIFEFGGINDWPYGTVKEEESEPLHFSSFGGGPQFYAKIADPEIAEVSGTVKEEESEEPIDGGAVDYYFTVTGKMPGSTRLTIEERSGSTENMDHIYEVVVGESGSVLVRKLTTENLEAMTDVSAALTAEIGGTVFYGTLEENESAGLFSEKLSREMIVLSPLSDEGNYLDAKLPWQLPIEISEVSAEPGDLILTEGDRIAVVKEAGNLSGVRLANLSDRAGNSIRDALNQGPEEIELWLEWDE